MGSRQSNHRITSASNSSGSFSIKSSLNFTAGVLSQPPIPQFLLVVIKGLIERVILLKKPRAILPSIYITILVVLPSST
jgi:hypothetical protein